jgi:anti-sigma28 factor (negative regulator of flagellin synthesis)
VEKSTSPHKLRRIQSEIDAGTYSTDAWKAADAMLKP